MTLRAIVISLVALILGLVLLYLSGRDDLWRNKAAAQTFVNNLAGMLIVAVALAFLWELAGKRAFSNEILEKAKVSSDLALAGIERITNQYIQDIEWEEYFRSVRSLDIFLAYGRTWRRTHWNHLQAVARRADARIRVVLPDPGDPATIQNLASRFNMPEGDLVSAINEATQEYLSLKATGGAEVTVHHRAGDLMFTYYRFDGRAIVILYSHARQRGLVPAFVCREGGTLYDFLRGQFDAVVSQGHQV